MNKGFIDYFKILGIEPTDDLKVIKRAYRKKAKECHPDVNKKIDEEEFKKVSDAYDHLKNKEELNEYLKSYIKNYYNNREEDYEEFRRKYDEVFNKKKEDKKERRKETKKSFINDLKNAYQEIRQDEKKNSFKKRHTRIEHKLNEMFKDERNIGEEVVFQLFRGTVHITREVAQQLRNISYISKDNIPKYVIRNRSLIGIVGVAVVITSMNNAKIAKDIPSEEVKTVSMTTVNEDNLTYELVRDYKIEKGDTLYDLSNESGTEINKIMEYNNLENDTIYYGDTIKIPYEVKKEDLNKYSKSVEVNNMSIYELANIYETTSSTIYNLNKESIIKENGNYYVLSSTLNMPNFISKTELNDNNKELSYTK